MIINNECYNLPLQHQMVRCRNSQGHNSGGGGGGAFQKNSNLLKQREEKAFCVCKHTIY